MKKTQLIDALRNIQKRFISFLSIVFIIMLGTGGFFMARYSAHGLMNSASRFYRAQNFKDYEVASSIGVTRKYAVSSIPTKAEILKFQKGE